MNDKTKINTPLFDPKIHDELTSACRDAVCEQIMKDWGGGFKKGEMVIFSSPGPTPFVPRDPDIHRGSLYPLIVHPVTQRKSAMVLDEAKKAGVKLNIPMEMSDDEMNERVLGISKYLVYPDSFRRTRPFDGQQYRRPIRMVERRLSLAVKEYIYSIPPKIKYVVKTQNSSLSGSHVSVGKISYFKEMAEEVRRIAGSGFPQVVHRPNHQWDPIVLDMLTGSESLKQQNVGRLRPEYKLDEILTQPLPEGKVTFSNLDSHSEFEDKKEEK